MLDLFHIISLRPLLDSILACGLNFRPFGLHLGLRPRYTALHGAIWHYLFLACRPRTTWVCMHNFTTVCTAVWESTPTVTFNYCYYRSRLTEAVEDCLPLAANERRCFLRQMTTMMITIMTNSATAPPNVPPTIGYK